MFLQNLNNENYAKTFHQKNRRRRDDWGVEASIMTFFVGANWTLSSPPVTETRLHSTAASIGSSATTGWSEDILRGLGQSSAQS